MDDSSMIKYSVPDVRRVQALLCEFVGTFFLVLTLTLSIPTESNSIPQFIAVGCTLGAMIYAFDHVSGAHFNPAVTVGAVIARRIGWGTALLYILAQCLGSMCGALLGLAVADPSKVQLFEPTGTGQAFVVEALYTFALVLVMQNAGLEKNAREPNSYFGLAVAFTVLAGAKAVTSISGGCFNPAVGLGLDFAAWLQTGDLGASMSSLWIYWVAPMSGAVAASFTKMYMNLPSHQEAEGLPLVVPLTECIGTFFVVLTAALTGEGLAVGSMLLAMVYMGDHVCGADYNPAVTLGVALRMTVPLREYWKVMVTLLAQFVGGLAAAGTAYYANGRVLNYPANDDLHGVAGAVLFEAVWTGLVVYVVCAVMTPTHGEDDPTVIEERKGHSRSYQGLAIGFAVAGGVYCATSSGGGSGGVFNPALGTAIMAVDAWGNGKSAANLWVYWVGPFAGSLLGAGLFTLLHYHRDPMLLDYEVEPSFY